MTTQDTKDINVEIKEMSEAILRACERRNWNPYCLNEAQLAEIVTVVLGEPIGNTDGRTDS